MSKKGENIYKRKDGRWEGRYIRCYDENGKIKYGYVYSKTYSETKAKVLEQIMQISNQNVLITKHTTLYKDVLTTWLQSLKINVKESTYARYVNLIKSHICPSLGKYQISKISTQQIEQFVEQKLQSGRLDNAGALSPKTVTDILTIIKSSMEYAKYNNINIICNLGKIYVKKKEKEMRVLCRSEQDALVKVLLDDIDLYKFGVILALYTGIRIGELCALKWENLCLDTHTLKVRETLQRIPDTNIDATAKTKVIITEPKSKCSVRDIPLPDFIVEIAKQFQNTSQAFILTGKNYKYIEPRTMQNHFKAYMKKSGIKAANFHSLRHTFATRCVEIGFELKSLSEILGHANVNITLNRYVHSSFDLKYNNMNKLSLL